MRYCAVLNCNNSSNKPSSGSSEVSFHKFPKDPETKQAWIYATGRINWTPRSYSTICSEHFTEYDFTIKNGKKFLRSTTVPRFNLNEQNSRYTEAQYHNETQAALESLTGQMFPESQIPAQEESEVVTIQVVGGNNPKVVVKKPAVDPQNKQSSPEKKPRYFSIVNVFKSEAELKAEKEKIDELVQNNLDPSISKVLLSLGEKPVKWKKKKKTNENSSHRGQLNLPRGKNGQWIKSVKKPPNPETSTTSEAHYSDALTKEQLIHQLKQRDTKIRQQQLTIRQLQKSHLRDQVELESLRIRLKLTNNQTGEEQTSEPFVQTPQYTHSDSTFKKPAGQEIKTQKRSRKVPTNTEDQYQSNSNFSEHDQAYYDTQNRHSEIGFKRPARQQIVKQKRPKKELRNTQDHYQSNRNVLGQDQAYYDTQSRHSEVGFKRPARQQIVIQKQQRIEPTNTENHYQSNRNVLGQDKAYYNTQSRHSEVGFKIPARQQIIIQKRQRIEPTNTENHYQSNGDSSVQNRAYFNTQNRLSDIGFKRPARQQNVVIEKQEILVPPRNENHNQSSMIFSDQDRQHFWNF